MPELRITHSDYAGIDAYEIRQNNVGSRHFADLQAAKSYATSASLTLTQNRLPIT